MTAVINTRTVPGRRTLHFATLDDLRAEVERLAAGRDLQALGNWSPGQVFRHLAIAFNDSIDGFHWLGQPVVRFIVRRFCKRYFLTHTMPAGIRLPARAARLIPPPTDLDEGLHAFRRALVRFQTEPRRMPHPVLGPLSSEEWIQFHCRHAELHLSFLIPLT